MVLFPGSAKVPRSMLRFTELEGEELFVMLKLIPWPTFEVMVLPRSFKLLSMLLVFDHIPKSKRSPISESLIVLLLQLFSMLATAPTELKE